MGQYFVYVNLDKKEIVSPGEIDDNGLKEMEHSYLSNSCVEAVVKLLATRWKGDRVIHLGDYADSLENEERFKPVFKEFIEAFNLQKDENGDYHYNSILERDDVIFIGEDYFGGREEIKKLAAKPIRYILVDNDKYFDRYKVKFGGDGEEKPIPELTEYDVGINAFLDEDGTPIKAYVDKLDTFSLATSLGIGGGGDYYNEESPLHGSLAGHRFEATNDINKLKGRKEINLSNFGLYSAEDLTQVVSNDLLRSILANKANIFTEIDRKILEDYLSYEK